MYEKYGEFDSYEEINGQAAKLKRAGDSDGIKKLAEENGIDMEAAEMYASGGMPWLTDCCMAAIGKLETESKALMIKGILSDWTEDIKCRCLEDEKLAAAIRKKGKSLKECMSRLVRYAFENKVQVSPEIVKITKVSHNGKEEALRGPLYLGFPDKMQARKIVKEYYLGADLKPACGKGEAQNDSV